MKQVAIVVDWYGPFSEEEAIKYIKKEKIDHAIYTVIGKQKCKRGNDKIQYIGLSKQTYSRLLNHSKIEHVTQNKQIWIGKISSFSVPGKKEKVTNIMTDLAEWAHVYFLKPALNRYKIINPPDKPVTVVNRWWKKDNTPYINGVHKDWPTLIDYFGKVYGAYIAWSGSRSPKRWKSDDF